MDDDDDLTVVYESYRNRLSTGEDDDDDIQIVYESIDYEEWKMARNILKYEYNIVRLFQISRLIPFRCTVQQISLRFCRHSGVLKVSLKILNNSIGISLHISSAVLVA